MKILLLTLFLLSSPALFAQSMEKFNEMVQLHDEQKYEEILKREGELLEWIRDRKDTIAADVLFYLADSNLKEGDVKKSVEYFEREKGIRENLLPADNENYGLVLFNLTYAYLQANDFINGKLVGQLLLEFDKKTHGISSEEYLSSVTNYADILVAAGEINEAELKLEQIRKQAPDFAKESGVLLSKLADVCSYGGKYRKAEQLFYDALELLRISDGEESEIFNITLSNYASLLMNQGKYDQAEGLFDQVLTTSADKGWFTNDTYYATLNNLALVQQSLGQYNESEKSYRKLMAVDSATIGVNHPDFSISLSNLGLLYIDQGRYAEAERVLKKSIDILKSNKETNTISYAKKLNNLAKAYQRSGKLTEASSLLQQALKIYGKRFGKQSPEYSFPLFNLGTVDMYQGSSKALSYLKSALDIREKTLGKFHPLYAECEERIAQYQWMKKNKSEANQSYKNVFENYYGQIDNYFPVLTEEEKSNFFFQKVKPSIEAYTTFVLDQLTEAEMLGQLYNYHVNTKGLILLATEKVRKTILASKDTTLISQFEKWENSKDVLTYYYSIRESQTKIDSLVRVSNDLEKLLVRKSSSFAKNMERQRVDWKSIQNKLKPGEAALECLRYRIYNPDSAQFTNTIGYAFLLLTSETKNGPVVIQMKNGKELESRYLNYYRNGIRLKVDDMFTYKMYWESIHDQLKKLNIKKVFFSPDGVYNTISVSSIRNPFTNAYLVDELEVRMVTSTRSLVEEETLRKDKSVGFLFGFPEYKIANQNNAIANSLNVSSTRSFRGDMLRFLRSGAGITPLPGTKVEVEQISSNLKKYFSEVQVNLGTEASESQIKSLSNPSIVHIATHGYFIDDESEGELLLPNPLMMSGLILAGAENFIQTGINPIQSNDDGILTAYEAMNLDLDETKLVVLSACETGLGKVKAGEGVYGLQRAFQVAGAEAIIMSLWSVDDAATQLLMSIFYEQYLQSNDLYTSFRTAQQKLKEKYPQPFYWGAFILVGKGE